MIYADNAATTQTDERVLEAMKPWLSGYANPSQPYAFSRAAKKAIAEARETVAGCIGAQAQEIFFTSGGTESDNWAVKIPLLEAIAERKNQPTLITSAFEHHAVLHSAAYMERLGAYVRYVMSDPHGVIGPDELKEALKDVGTGRGTLVSIMAVNNELGTVQPIKALCELVKEACPGALFHTDAVQAVPHMSVNVNDLGIDLLSASAHKFHGPRGVGFLYAKNGAIADPLIHGGGQESGMRAGTENTAGIVGMALALKLARDEMAQRQRHIAGIEEVFLHALRDAGVAFARNGKDPVPGVLSLSFPGENGERLLHRLDLMGVCVSTGSACNGSSDEISHVLKAIKLDRELALGTIRISFGDRNTPEDAQKTAGALIEILSKR